MRSLQRVLVDIAIFHDQVEILVWISDQVQILERIAVYKNQVRIGAFLEYAQRACLVRVARAGEARHSRPGWPPSTAQPTLASFPRL